MRGHGPDEVVDEVEIDLPRARLYAEGWQSWSPATWYPAASSSLRPAGEPSATMRFRPGTPVAPSGVQAEGVLVVDPGTGDPARCYGAVDGERVPTLRAVAVGDRIQVHCSAREDGLDISEHDARGALTAPPPQYSTATATILNNETILDELPEAVDPEVDVLLM